MACKDEKGWFPSPGKHPRSTGKVTTVKDEMRLQGPPTHFGKSGSLFRLLSKVEVQGVHQQPSTS